MTVIALGALTVGDAVPGATIAVSSGVAGVTGAIPDLQSRIVALNAFDPTPITFAEQLTICNSILVSINAAIAFGIVPPSISDQIAIVTAQLLELSAQLLVIQGELATLTALGLPLQAGGLRGYAYDGDASTAGAELGVAIAADFIGHVNAVVLVTSSAFSWAALGEIIKVTP
jgi:hypothetical protein